MGKVKSHTGNRFSYMGKAKSLAGNRFSRAGKVKSHTGNRFSCVRKPKSLAGEDGFRRAVELVRFVEHPEALVPLGDESDVRVVMTKVLHT